MWILSYCKNKREFLAQDVTHLLSNAYSPPFNTINQEMKEVMNLLLSASLERFKHEEK